MTRRAFTLIELLVVITIIALLIGLLVPVLASARVAVIGTNCIVNQDQMMTGMFAFAADHRGKIPFGPEERLKYPPPQILYGEDSGGRDFYVIDGMVTSEISTINGDLVGIGLLLQGYMSDAKEAFFCPGADQTVSVQGELDRVGKGSVISGYLYRHGGNTFVDGLAYRSNPGANPLDKRTRLDRLGANREGLDIRALLMDNNFQTADGSSFNWLDRSNHERVFSNIAFADGHVEQRPNLDGRYVADIGGTTLIGGLDRILGVFEEADRPE